MKSAQKALLTCTMLFASLKSYAAYLEIDVANEIDLKNGAYIAKEYEGQGRYALISHDHGRFEGQNIMSADCSEGYLVSKLPPKFSNAKSVLNPHDYLLTVCQEDY